MAVIKGIEKVVKGEGFDLGVLKTIVKVFNEAGLIEKKIRIVAVKTEALASEFMVAVEAVPKEREKEIPKDVLNLYNAYADVIDDKKVGITVNGEVEKKEKEGKKIGDGKPKSEKDAYGFRVDSIMHKVALMVEKGGTEGVTVKDIRSAEWNVRKNSYKSYWMKMVENGFAECRDGRIYTKGGE